MDSSDGYKDSFRLSLPVEVILPPGTTKNELLLAGQLLKLKAKIIFATVMRDQRKCSQSKTSVVKIADDNNKHTLNYINQITYCIHFQTMPSK